jgi:hypothetical protein
MAKKNVVKSIHDILKDVEKSDSQIKMEIERNEIDSTKPNDYVYCSMDYEKFVFIKGNRGIIQSNLLRIIESMKRKFFKNPIFVCIMEDGNFGIFDGQHRYLASKELGKPIYYIIQDNCEVSLIPDLQISKQWTDWDFIQSFAEQGNIEYQKILELRKMYPEFKFVRIYILLSLMKNKYWNNKNQQESPIRSGTFQFTHWEKTIEYCNMIMDFKVCESNTQRSPWGTSIFFTSLIKLIKLPCYDHERMKKKITKYPNMIQRQNTLKEYIRQFSIVYNYSQSNKVYFENNL